MTIGPPPASLAGNGATPSEPVAPGGGRGPQVWTSTTYFAEGFPYGAVVNLADLFFVSRGASLEAVGLTSLFHLPWNLKFLVGPFVDAYATKRRWLIAVEVLLTGALALLAFFASLHVTLMQHEKLKNTKIRYQVGNLLWITWLKSVGL